MVGPSVFPNSQVIPKWLVLQYFQIHESYQNGWIYSISRCTSYIKMIRFSVFYQIHRSSKWVDFQYFQVPTILERLTTQHSYLFLIIFIRVPHFGPESHFQPPQYTRYYNPWRRSQTVDRLVLTLPCERRNSKAWQGSKHGKLEVSSSTK